MLIREVIERVTSIYSQGAKFTHSRLSNRRIYRIMVTTRAKILTQMVNKKQDISQANFETLPCVKLIDIDRHSCSCSLPTNCNVLRSENKIPNIVKSMFGYLVNSITLIDGSMINQTSSNNAKYVKYNKYTGKDMYWFLLDNYLYIVNLQHVEYVTVTAVFEDLLDKYYDFACDDIRPCNYSALNQDFHFDESMTDALVMMCVQEISALQDTKRNKKEEPQQEQQQNDE